MNGIRTGFAWALVVVVLTLQGCGFQLRGANLDMARIPSPIQITGIDPLSGLGRELRFQLEQAGAVVVPTGTEGTAQLAISGRRSTSRVLSLDSRNKAVEFELIEAASFAVRTTEDTEAPSAPQAIVVQRLLFQPEGAVLGSSREADLLREDMRRELAERMLLRVARAR